MGDLLLSVRKRCPCCNKLIDVDVVQTIDDGESPDEMNTEVRLLKRTPKN